NRKCPSSSAPTRRNRSSTESVVTMSSYVHSRAIEIEHSWMVNMRTTSIFAALLIAGAAALAPPSAQAQTSVAPVRTLTIEDAVRLALDNNLGVQIARINPQISDLSVALARAAWLPTFSTTVQGSNASTPNSSFLSGGTTSQSGISTGRLSSNIGMLQQTPWG